MTVLDKPSLGAVLSTPFRLAATIVAAAAVATGILVAALVWHTNAELAAQTLEDIGVEAEEFVHLARTGTSAEFAETVRRRSDNARDGLYLLENGQGLRLAGNLAEMPVELAGGSGGGVFRYQRPGDERQRLAVARVIELPSARLVVGRDVEAQSRFVRRVVGWSLAGFGLLALTGLAGGLILGRSLLARIEAINTASRSIMAGDLSRRIPLAGSGDEIDGLAANLNAMLERIEELMHALREVSDNIAHDLKTPLNRLRNRAEQALRDPSGDGACRDGLERVIEQADDLIKTFNALLLIARLEAGAIEETIETVAIGEVVRDVVELYEPVAEEQGLALAVDVTSAPCVAANRQLIGQAIANLVDNAIKYAAAASTPRRIEIMAATRGAHCVVSVADHGPGISAQDRERVLRRFVRLDKSRTKPGTGLGLSLVAAVARLHGGVLNLEDNSPGLRAVLVLPKERCQGAA